CARAIGYYYGSSYAMDYW
nr:immunoglobulin heavy chain junction region [Mus musculus]